MAITLYVPKGKFQFDYASTKNRASNQMWDFAHWLKAKGYIWWIWIGAIDKKYLGRIIEEYSHWCAEKERERWTKRREKAERRKERNTT